MTSADSTAILLNVYAPLRCTASTWGLIASVCQKRVTTRGLNLAQAARFAACVVRGRKVGLPYSPLTDRGRVGRDARGQPAPGSDGRGVWAGCWRRWTGIEPAGRGSLVPTALKAAEPTRYPDTSASESTRNGAPPRTEDHSQSHVSHADLGVIRWGGDTGGRGRDEMGTLRL